MLIELHIEHLVVHGSKNFESVALQDALTTELTRLISENGAPNLFNQTGQISYLRGENISLAPATNAGGLGSQIAASVYTGMQKRESYR